MTIKEAAEKWNLSVRRVQTICNIQEWFGTEVSIESAFIKQEIW